MDLLRGSIEDPASLRDLPGIDAAGLRRVTDVYPMRINPYVLGLIRAFGASVARQFIPDLREIEDAFGMEDPLAEETHSPVPCVTHRYPDRVLFRVSDVCGAYCRFCTRKRLVGRGQGITDSVIERGARYIEEHSAVHDVLLSGGDPLLLEDERLDWILGRLRPIGHLDFIRIGTRVPSVLPQRIMEKLVRVLAGHAPLYVNTHFNHPDELTPEAMQALRLLADAGIPLANQTVLLRGVNDSYETLASLMRGLLRNRVRPYYLHQGDLTCGTNHFRTSIETGLAIMERLRGRVSGMAIPTYVVDLPGGGGKVPLTPEYIVRLGGDSVELRNYEDRRYFYPLPQRILEEKGTYHASEI